MKISFLTPLTSWIKSHRLISGIGLAGLIILLCAASWYGWTQYQYRQTSQYAFEKLKQTLNPPQAAELSKIVDFNALSHDLVQATIKNFPFFMAGPDQERNISHTLQTALLREFLANEKAAPISADESEEKALKKPVRILPPDFIAQLLQTATLRQTDDNSALISTKITNPQLGKPFTLIFGLRHGQDGWKLRSFANAQEVITQLNQALLARHNRLREVFNEKNEVTAKKMNELLPIQSCSANAGLLSDGKTLIMTVQVIARNRGSVQVNNFSLDTEIIGKDHQPITRRFLNVAKPVAPGEDFNHSWSFELDSQSDLAQNIMSGIPISCKANWQTLGLNNHQVWHIEEVPNPDRQCSLDGHDHPEGFCLLPIFQQ